MTRRRQSLAGKPSAAPSRLVEIGKPIYGGAFLARAEGKAVFVPLVLPGEQARVRMVDEKRSYATAEAEQILAPSALRVAAPCPYFGRCGGCQYQHAGYEAQLNFKTAILRETLERGGVRAPEEIAVLAAEPWAYRNRVRLAFDAAGNPGYRGRRSHHLIAIAECPIAAPLLVQAAKAFAALFRQIAPALRPTEISLFANAEETELLASLFIERPATEAFDDLARAMHEKIPALRGVELVVEDRAGGGAGQLPRSMTRWGEPCITYRAAGFDYRVAHGAFFQVNRWLADALVEAVTGGRRGALAWDLFAGVGLFARRLADSFDRVVAIESSPAAVESLAHNLAGSNASAADSTTLNFLRGTAGGRQPGLKSGAPRPAISAPTLPDFVRPDLIVADPPRAGLGEEIVALLAGIAAPSLVYVSCDPATLARDLRGLVATGYAIDKVTLADLFPQTFHLETIVELRR